MSPESYPTAASTLPDIEDINNDNTLSEYERYYQYHVSIRKQDMVQGQNYISAVKESQVELKNGQVDVVKWYQFKIPIKTPEQTFGNISDFKSIRFLRMFLRGFQDSTILRFAELDLVRADWRRYTRNLGDNEATSPNAGFDISAVSIEENGSQDRVNYILPPGIDRVISPSDPQLRQLNEQSMLMKVTDLEQGDAKAAYKSIGLDFRRYKRLKMEIHAEEIEDSQLEDNELYFFIRLGSDYNNNYYEYEIPLKLTPILPKNVRYNGDNESDRYIVWPDENRLDIPLDLFTELKLQRNDAIRPANSTITIQDVFEIIDTERSRNKAQRRVKIKGNPNLGNVEVMMMGIRNRREQINTGPKSVVVWLNELRLSEFDESGGWAANARVSTRLADLGNVTVAGRTRTGGYGSVSENINSRQLDDINEVDVSASLDFGRFFPENAGVRLPLYYGFSRSAINPKYNPLDPDIELSQSLDHADTKQERDSIKSISQDLVTRKSISINNAKIEPQKQSEKVHLWDAQNFAISYSYNEIEKKNINTEYNSDKTHRVMFSYNYSSRAQLVQPFQKIQFMQKFPFRLIGKFNFYPLPTQISFRTDLFRRYHETQTRNITNPNLAISPNFEKDFLWNRYFDLRYDVSRTLKVDFSSSSTSRIDEPEGRINRHDDDYQWKKDSILNNLWELGRPTLYNHNINATYTIPINQIPMLNFMSSTLRYTGTYNWVAGPITADTIRLGNRVQNSNDISLNGSMNLTGLYNKVPYLRQVNQKFRRTGRAQGSLARRNGNQTNQQVPQGNQEQTFTNNVKLVKDQPQKITHRLNTKKFKVVVTGEDGAVIPVRVNTLDANSIEIVPLEDSPQAMLTVTGKPGDQSLIKDVLDFTTRVLIGVQNISGTYSKSGGTVLPGYLPEPVVFGAGNYTPDPSFGYTPGSSFAPGMPFLLGWQDINFAQKAAQNGWVTNDSTLNMPYLFTKNERINMRSTFEPIPDLRIDISADRSMSKNISQFYQYDYENGIFNANSLTESGSFSMSTLTWGTAFFGIGQGKVTQSEAFENFKTYRETISRRLAEQRNPDNGFGYNPDAPHPENGSYRSGYGPNSVEVLVPAFLAAYQGRDPEKVSLSMFPSLKFIRPNWQIRYEGMVSRVPALSNIMKTMNITHGYRSTYSIGSYITNLNYFERSDGYSYATDQSGNFIPKYDFTSVSIAESFSPLINLNIMWLNDLSTTADIKRTRRLNLSLANNQLIEDLSNEYTFGVGYRFTRMDLIIKTKNSQKAYSNDLNVRADVSYRKNKTTLRKLDEPDQITAGQSNFTIKTYAEYMLSDRFQMRVFFDKIMTNPFVETSYKTSSTNIGVSFRFTLAQ